MLTGSEMNKWLNRLLGAASLLRPGFLYETRSKDSNTFPCSLSRSYPFSFVTPRWAALDPSRITALCWIDRETCWMNAVRKLRETATNAGLQCLKHASSLPRMFSDVSRLLRCAGHTLRPCGLAKHTDSHGRYRGSSLVLSPIQTNRFL